MCVLVIGLRPMHFYTKVLCKPINCIIFYFAVIIFIIIMSIRYRKIGGYDFKQNNILMCFEVDFEVFFGMKCVFKRIIVSTRTKFIFPIFFVFDHLQKIIFDERNVFFHKITKKNLLILLEFIKFIVFWKILRVCVFS